MFISFNLLLYLVFTQACVLFQATYIFQLIKSSNEKKFFFLFAFRIHRTVDTTSDDEDKSKDKLKD